MSMQNLAIVFGPTLFGLHTSANGQGGVMSDTTFQNMVRAFSLIVVSCCYSCMRRLNCRRSRRFSTTIRISLSTNQSELVLYCPACGAPRIPCRCPRATPPILYDTHLCFAHALARTLCWCALLHFSANYNMYLLFQRVFRGPSYYIIYLHSVLYT